MPLFFCLRNQFRKQTENRPPEFPEPNGGNGGRENPEPAKPEALPCIQFSLYIDRLFDIDVLVSINDAVPPFLCILTRNRKTTARFRLQRVVQESELVYACIRYCKVILQMRGRVLHRHCLRLFRKFHVHRINSLDYLRPDFHLGAVVYLDTGYCMS